MYRCFFLLFLSLIMFGGCSGGSNVLIPQSASPTHLAVNDIDSIPAISVTERYPDGSPAGGVGMLGLFELHIEPSNFLAELSPLRKVDLTDTLETVDITNFLTLAPCVNCVKIKSVSLNTDEKLEVRIGIKHPFDVGDPTKPITGRNRADLHVFNIEGIIVSNSHATYFPGLGESIAGFRLLNADGYTDYLDRPLDEFYVTEASIHPYKLHFDDYSIGNFDALNPMGFESVINPPPTGNLVMAMGCDYSYQDYVFDFTNGSIDLIYAVGCTYGVSAANKSLRFTPEYRIPQHNKKAASEVQVEIISNDLTEGQISSSAEIAVKVLDMNHGIAVGTSLDQMLADSSVKQISVEIPNVTASPVVDSSPIPTGGNGRDPLDPLNFNMTVSNSASAVEGTYVGLVKVLDNYPTGLNTSPLLNNMDGIKRVSPVDNPLTGLFEISEFATYAVFTIDVAPGGIPVACFTTNPDPPEVRIEINGTISFDGSCSYDPNAYNIALWEWDFDWDGQPMNFTADESNSFPVTNHLFTIPGTFKVGLRVTNDAPSPQVSEIISADVIIHGWYPSLRITNDTLNQNMWWATNPMMAITSDGKVHIAVECYGTTAPIYTIRHYVCDETGLLSEEILANVSTTMTGIRVDSNDDLYVWYCYNGIIYYMKTTSGVFGPPQTIFSIDSGYNNNDISLSISNNGDLLVLESEMKYPDTTPSYPAKIYASVNEGSGFGPKVLLHNPERQRTSTGGVLIMLDSAVDSNGTFYLIWQGLKALWTSDIDLWYAYYDGTFSSPMVFEDTTGDEILPKLEVDGNNNVWAGYRLGYYHMLRKKPSTTHTFEPSFTAANPSKQNWDFDIDPDTGRVFHVWYAATSGINKVFSKLYNISDSPAAILSAFEFRIDQSSDLRQVWAQVEIDPDGHAFAMWEDQRYGSETTEIEIFLAKYY